MSATRTVIYLTEAGLNNPVLLADELGHILTGQYARRLGRNNWHHRVSFRMLDRAVRRGDVQLTAPQQAELVEALRSAAAGN